MIKRKLSIMVLAVIASVTLSSVASQAALVAANDGDLILGFRDTVNSNDFQFTLGSTTALRNNGNLGLLGNIGSSLTVFDNGGNWYSSSNLFMGAVGAFSNAANPGGPVNSGDPSRTLYFSKSRSNPAVQATGITLNIGSQRGVTAGNIVSLVNDMKLQTSTTGDNKGLLVSDSAGFANWSDYTVPASDFTNLGTIDQSMSVINDITFMGIAHVEAVIDIFRMIDTTVGASPSGTVGASQYVTTVAITQSGDIYAVPEPSTYALLGLAGIGIAAFARRKKCNA